MNCPEIDSVIDIVKSASSLMMTREFAIKQKDGVANIVTSSDIAVQKFLIGELSGLLPGCGFVCEEEGVLDPDKEFVWVIDPIDGTTNYARGIDHCAISVGLKHGDDIELGVVYSPSRGELYSAVKGQGAFCNGKPIHVSDRPFEAGIFCSALSVYHKEYAEACSDVILETFSQCNDVRRFGAASVEICFLARGLCELYFEMSLMPWDHSAGLIILREAGGVISNLSGNTPSFSHPDLVCAANSPESHARLLSILRKHIPVMPY